MNLTATEPRERVLRPRGGWIGIDFAGLIRRRELLAFLVWRDILIRYKQTALGALWAVGQPALATAIFTFVFSRVAGLSSGSAPYAVMALAGILPWQLFARALGESGASLLSAGSLIGKVYFPRMIIPAAAVLGGLMDFIISCGLLAGLMAWNGVTFEARLLWLPLFMGLGLCAALGAGLWLSALSVKYRDVRFITPFMVQMGLYLSPVGVRTSFFTEKLGAGLQWLYYLNPMVGVIDGFRWAILGAEFTPDWRGFAISAVMALGLLVSGACYFSRFERTFADVI